jgi:predicted amidohydrolase
MKIYCCQPDIVWENKEANFKQVRTLLGKRKLSPKSLVILPEMFATGFTMNADAVAEDKNGPTDCFLREVAREKGAFIVGGLVRASERQMLNQAVCIAASGRRIARYDKLHLFSPGNESRHYAPGTAVTLFRWEQFKVGLFICYDLRFPEVFRMAVQRGADVLVVIANWPSKRRAHWTTLLRARAIENQAYVIGVNRCGRDPQTDYHGGSVVINPWGETVCEAGPGAELLSADLDLAVIKQIRGDFPVLRDARTRYALTKPAAN